MALAHLLMIFAEDQGDMSKFRRFIAKCFIDGKLTRGIRKMLFGTDDMGDFHEGIIDHDSEIIDRDTVGFHDDEITDTGRLITVEDHYAVGGLGDAVARAVAPIGGAVTRMCVRDIPRSGTPDELVHVYGLSAQKIADAVRAK